VPTYQQEFTKALGAADEEKVKAMMLFPEQFMF
jgi:hypothetical protein